MRAPGNPSDTNLKPILALVRLDASPPSIRWVVTSLILYACVAEMILGSMPNPKNRSLSATKGRRGMCALQMSLFRVLRARLFQRTRNF